MNIHGIVLKPKYRKPWDYEEFKVVLNGEIFLATCVVIALRDKLQVGRSMPPYAPYLIPFLSL